MTNDDDFIVSREPLPSHLESVEVLFGSYRRECWRGDLDEVVGLAVAKLVKKAKAIPDCVGLYQLDVKITDGERVYTALAIGTAAKQLPETPNDLGL